MLWPHTYCLEKMNNLIRPGGMGVTLAPANCGLRKFIFQSQGFLIFGNSSINSSVRSFLALTFFFAWQVVSWKAPSVVYLWEHLVLVWQWGQDQIRL